MALPIDAGCGNSGLVGRSALAQINTMQQLQALAYLWRGLLGLQYSVNILNTVNPYGTVAGPACAGPEDLMRAELMGMGSWLATALGMANLADAARILAASPVSRMTAGDLYAEIGAAKRLYFNGAHPLPPP